MMGTLEDRCRAALATIEAAEAKSRVNCETYAAEGSYSTAARDKAYAAAYQSAAATLRAALLTGEGEAKASTCRRGCCPADDPPNPELPDLDADSDPRTPAPVYEPGVTVFDVVPQRLRALADDIEARRVVVRRFADGGTIYNGRCAMEIDYDKALGGACAPSPDPRTPGQVAFDAYGAWGGTGYPWRDCPCQEAYEHMAAAVLAHAKGRGL